VGIDSLNIDDDKDGTPPLPHTILLGAGVAIVRTHDEPGFAPRRGLSDSLPCPPRVRGMGSFPVRAIRLGWTRDGRRKYARGVLRSQFSAAVPDFRQLTTSPGAC